MRSKAYGVGLACVLAFGACDNGDSSPAGPTVGGSAGKSGGAAGSGSASGTSALRVEIKVAAVAPGAEDHVCVIAALPNDARVWAKSIHTTLTRGSHHLIVDRRPASATLNATPTPCQPTMGGDATRLIIAQQPDTKLAMPARTGLPLEAHQPIFLQLHYINNTSKSADIAGVVELELLDTSAGAPIEVQSLFAGSTNFSIPRHAASMAEFFYLPPATASRRMQAFAVTSHTHSLGVNATIERVTSATAATTQPIHESDSWDEPPLTRFDPPLIFEGKDGLRLRCRFQNDTDHDVSFGTRFEDEMCFMWLYYYVEP